MYLAYKGMLTFHDITVAGQSQFGAKFPCAFGADSELAIALCIHVISVDQALCCHRSWCSIEVGRLGLRSDATSPAGMHKAYWMYLLHSYDRLTLQYSCCAAQG